jgi:L-asparaginase
MSKIAIIFTGGTIAMQVDESNGLAKPALSGEDIIANLSDQIDTDDIEIHNFGNYPSPHIGFDEMFSLYSVVEKVIKSKVIDGVVITHGTDILEETAYFIDCMYGGLKPIVLVGAMKNSSELGYEGLANLVDAIMLAKSSSAKGLGVLVAMAGEIHAARDVTKTHTSSIETFKSPGKGPIGIIDGNKVIFYRSVKRRLTVKPKKVNAKVSLIKVVAGMNGDFVQYSIRNNYQGIVIEAFGRGNLPPAVAEKLKEAIKLNLVVVICSRCQSGRVSPDYGYLGGANDLRQAGAILAGSMSGIKARIRLSTALSSGLDRQAIRMMFNSDDGLN